MVKVLLQMVCVAATNLRSLYSDFYPINDGCPSIYNFSTDYHPFHITDCSFISLTSTLQGSVLYYSNNMVRCLVENSLFAFCTSSRQGGVIMFSCSNSGDFIMSKCCSHCCYTTGTYDGQLGYFITGATSKIEFHYVSIFISSTGKSIKSTYYTNGGRIMAAYNNMTTYCYTLGIASINSPTKCIFEYSNVKNSYCSNGGGFQISSGTGPLHVSKSNFVDNTFPSGYGLIISTSCNIEVHSSIFIGNKVLLFQGTAYILGCFLNHSLTISNVAMITVKPNGEMDGVYPYNCINNAMCMISTYNMRLFGTAYCEAESYTSTPHPSNDPVCIPPTPAQSLPASPTECFYQTNQAISLISRVLQLITLLSYSLFTISC